MLIIGLTGGIATGKSTVSQHFRSKGVTVVDCDEIAHKIAKKVGSRAFKANLLSVTSLAIALGSS